VTDDLATRLVRAVADAARGPVSVVVTDDHGEVVAALRMDGAALDTFENARRKAYTAARGGTLTTRALAAAVGGEPTELASFDPQVSFFLGGVAVVEDGRRIGAIGVSGLPGEEDEALAFGALRAAGLGPPS
jgi:uncharacterized protein GlcG (DUF336 family)